MRKIVISLLMLVAMTSVYVSNIASAATTFKDIGSTHRAQAEIYYLVNKGIANGTSESYFSPDREVTRGEATAMLARALGIPATKQSTGFKDVPSTHAFSGYIAGLVNKGVISGYADGTFQPNKVLTRGEMALLISRSFSFNSSSVTAAANDLMNYGIAQGVGDGTFGTSLKIKRADFSVFLARSINKDFRVINTSQFKEELKVEAGSDTLNMRSGPGTEYGVVRTLTSGTVVRRATTTGSWSYILVGNQVGYVHSAYLKQVSSSGKPSTPGSLSDIVVIIDPGHGGTDPGALAVYKQLEKNIVLDVSLKMKKYFDQTPIQAKMTRSTDVFVTLNNRAKFAQQNGGDIFISVHGNSCCGASGQETFYYSRASNPNVAQSKALASYVQYRMVEAWKLPDRGVKKGNLHVLRENTIPAVLAEIGFIDNPKDFEKMRTDAGKDQMGKALFLATLDYYHHYEGRKDIAPLYAKFGAKPSPKRH